MRQDEISAQRQRRKEETARLLAQGLQPKEIAAQMGVVVTTIEKFKRELRAEVEAAGGEVPDHLKRHDTGADPSQRLNVVNTRRTLAERREKRIQEVLHLLKDEGLSLEETVVRMSLTEQTVREYIAELASRGAISWNEIGRSARPTGNVSSCDEGDDALRNYETFRHAFVEEGLNVRQAAEKAGLSERSGWRLAEKVRRNAEARDVELPRRCMAGESRKDDRQETKQEKDGMEKYRIFSEAVENGLLFHDACALAGIETTTGKKYLKRMEKEGRRPEKGLVRPDGSVRGTQPATLVNTVRTCEYCGKEFHAAQRNQRFCTEACWLAWRLRARRKEKCRSCSYGTGGCPYPKEFRRRRIEGDETCRCQRYVRKAASTGGVD